jgi:hypothetical protein
MHPDITKALVAERHADLKVGMAASRRGPRRHIPRWHVTWSRASVTRGKSWVIIISATK